MLDERVQERALRIVAWSNVLPYSDLLRTLNVTSLKERRSKLIGRFTRFLLESKQHRYFLPKTQMVTTGRSLRNVHYLELPRTRTKRYQWSPIPHLVQLLNYIMSFHNCHELHRCNIYHLIILQWTCNYLPNILNKIIISHFIFFVQ